jgi:hypothetical protein
MNMNTVAEFMLNICLTYSGIPLLQNLYSKHQIIMLLNDQLLQKRKIIK